MVCFLLFLCCKAVWAAGKQLLSALLAHVRAGVEHDDGDEHQPADEVLHRAFHAQNRQGVEHDRHEQYADDGAVDAAAAASQAGAADDSRRYAVQRKIRPIGAQPAMMREVYITPDSAAHAPRSTKMMNLQNRTLMPESRATS